MWPFRPLGVCVAFGASRNVWAHTWSLSTSTPLTWFHYPFPLINRTQTNLLKRRFITYFFFKGFLAKISRNQNLLIWSRRFLMEYFLFNSYDNGCLAEGHTEAANSVWYNLYKLNKRNGKQNIPVLNLRIFQSYNFSYPWWVYFDYGHISKSLYMTFRKYLGFAVKFLTSSK